MIQLLFYLILAAPSQDNPATIKQIDDQLSKGATTVNAVLTNQSYLQLHMVPAFRNVIKKHAKAGPLHLVTSKEPGIQTLIKGKIVSGNSPVRNALVYIYHTDYKGLYFPEGESGNNRNDSRLFGYFKTGESGEFELHTIRPASYPSTTIAQHIHLEIFSETGRELLVTELLFDDDPMLTGQARQQYLSAGFVIAKNTGSKDKQVFSYEVKLRNN
jgi:protocatechuate 3,4-dioxygenase beta subunit